MSYQILSLKWRPKSFDQIVGQTHITHTLNNAIFCQRFDQNNSELNKKILNIKKKLDSGFPSVPSTIKDELNCNIFLRAKNQEEFSKLRDLKDNF